MCEGFDGLMGRSILTETDGVVSGDPDNSLVGERGETNSTGCVGDEVEESSASGNDGAVGAETVHDGSHGVLTHTIADVSTRPLADSEAGRLEVDGLLPPGVV